MPISAGVYSKIIDKSGYTPEDLTAGLAGLFPIASTRGEDNVIRLMSSLGAALNTYGEPKYNKFGLSYNMATQWLKGGQVAHVCRLLPSDARFANVKATVTDVSVSLPTPDTAWGGFFSETTTFAAGSFTNYKGAYYQNTSGSAQTGAFDSNAWTVVTVEFSENSTYAVGDAVIYKGSLYVNAVAVTTAGAFDPSSWTLIYYMPTYSELVSITLGSSANYTSLGNIEADLSSDNSAYMVFNAVGRGVDYNKLSIEIKHNSDLAATYRFAMYDVVIYDKDSNNLPIVAEEYTVSLDPDATDLTGESLFIEDFINKYSNLVNVRVNFTNLENILFPAVQLYVNPDATVEDVYTDSLIDSNGVTVEFANGDEGSLINTQGRFDLTVFEELVRDFLAGVIDNRVTNFKEIDSKVIFDAGYSVPTKLAISQFTASTRPDIIAYLDTSLQANEEQELTFRSAELTIDNYRAVIQPGNFKVFDNFTGKYIKVPALYQLCYNIAVSWKNNGVGVPVAGYNARGNIAGVLKDSLAYNPAKIYQDKFTLVQLNPIVQDPTGLYRMGIMTSQKKNSALSKESIVKSLQIMDVELTLASQVYLFEFINPEVLSDIKNRFTGYFSKWLRKGVVESVNVNAFSSPLDKKQGIVRVNIELQFTGIIEKMYLNFIVK